LTVGFGVAPNLLTLHFPVFPETEGARGLGLFTLTAGGDFHPALRTSAARNGHLPEIMAKACPAGKHIGMWEPACRHAPATNPDRPTWQICGKQKLPTGLRP
jgi:hypothetical protein